jgi:hypothetical protein
MYIFARMVCLYRGFTVVTTKLTTVRPPLPHRVTHVIDRIYNIVVYKVYAIPVALFFPTFILFVMS